VPLVLTGRFGQTASHLSSFFLSFEEYIVAETYSPVLYKFSYMEKIILHPFLRNQKCSFVIPIQSTQIALQLVRQGLSNEPPRDITIVETTKLEDKNSENSLAEDASVDVNRTESSFENIDVVPLTTISEVDPNEHSNEAPTKTGAEETAKIFSTSSTDEVI
jgi:hypothetical protein